MTDHKMKTKRGKNWMLWWYVIIAYTIVVILAGAWVMGKLVVAVQSRW